jgi:hypothetical protein
MAFHYRASDRTNFEPIAKDASSPLEPKPPSLLTLPPEICNAIYNALFDMPGGIRIAPMTVGAPRDIFQHVPSH